MKKVQETEIDAESHRTRERGRQLLQEYLQSRNPTALAELYRLVFPSLVAYANSILKDEHKAEDVVQEVFIKLIGSNNFSKNSHAGLLRTMTRNSAFDVLKNKKEAKTVSYEGMSLVHEKSGEPNLPEGGVSVLEVLRDQSELKSRDVELINQLVEYFEKPDSPELFKWEHFAPEYSLKPATSRKRANRLKERLNKIFGGPNALRALCSRASESARKLFRLRKFRFRLMGLVTLLVLVGFFAGGLFKGEQKGRGTQDSPNSAPVTPAGNPSIDERSGLGSPSAGLGVNSRVFPAERLPYEILNAFDRYFISGTDERGTPLDLSFRLALRTKGELSTLIGVSGLRATKVEEMDYPFDSPHLNEPNWVGRIRKIRNFGTSKMFLSWGVQVPIVSWGSEGAKDFILDGDDDIVMRDGFEFLNLLKSATSLKLIRHLVGLSKSVELFELVGDKPGGFLWREVSEDGEKVDFILPPPNLEELESRFDNSDRNAAIRIARSYLSGRYGYDPIQVRYWYERAIDVGRGDARLELASLLLIGEWMPRDTKKAMALLNPLAAKGDREAAFWLSYAYHNGLGVGKNVEVSSEWFKKSGLDVAAWRTNRVEFDLK